MSKQFELVRGALLQFAGNVDERVADVQPAGLNNTIRWHIGHVLVTAEQFLFGYPERSTYLPAAYKAMFGSGTKPADWTEEAPSLEQLTAMLDEQAKRIRELPEDFFAQKLPFQLPFGNFETFGELFELTLYHEAEHLGQMKAMKRIVQA